MRTLIEGGTIVNEGRTFDGFIIVNDGYIMEVIEGRNTRPQGTFDEVIDATGCYVLPGIIDTHVHFREPGMTDRADIDTESAAAAAGGVTSYFDMPNTNPPTTTIEALAAKMSSASQKSHVNYSFFVGATNGNAGMFHELDASLVPGIKLFMGSSTGNMLVDRREALDAVFGECAALGLPVVTHCEDTNIINRNMAEAKARYGDDPNVSHHPEIRSVEACYQSSRLAVQLAREHGTRLHVAHLTTERELELFDDVQCTKHNLKGTMYNVPLPQITAEATVSHLYFSDRDYARLGTRIKCNPAVKTERDREALRQALADGRITTIATDHAPHLLTHKEGGCARAASGMPMVQFSLVTMLELADQGVLTLPRLVELMCHNPARVFDIHNRGFLRPCFRADITIVRPGRAWTVTPECILSKCGWSPMEGHTYLWQVQRTLCNGHTVYHLGRVDRSYIGEPVQFSRHAV